MAKLTKKIWLVKHPIHKHYKETQEEVKMLALKNHLKIICASRSDRIDPELVTNKPPKLTPIDAEEKAPAKTKTPAKTED